MANKKVIRGFLAGLVLLGASAALHSDSLVMTTFYPSPAGIYRTLTTTQTTVLARDAGLVGIGTPNPSVPLEIRGSQVRKIHMVHPGAGGKTLQLQVGNSHGVLATDGHLSLHAGSDLKEGSPDSMSMEISADGNVSIPGGATHPDFRLNVAGKVNAVEYYQKGHPYLPGIQGTFQRFYNEGNGAYRDCRHAWGKASCGLTAGGSPGGCQPGFSPYTLMTAYDRDPVCKGGDCHVALVGCAR